MSYLAPIDYQETQFDFREKYRKFSRGIDVLSDEELERVPSLRLMLKNAVMHKVLELRFKHKANNLNKILMKGVERMMKKRGEFKAYFDQTQKIGLKERLASIENRKLRVKDEKFDKIKRATTFIG